MFNLSLQFVKRNILYYGKTQSLVAVHKNGQCEYLECSFCGPHLHGKACFTVIYSYRLSKVASANLTLDNPNIADLSDQNRPTKIAESFSELYDNEWTDAFEAIVDKQSEKQVVKELLRILQVSLALINI